MVSNSHKLPAVIPNGWDAHDTLSGAGGMSLAMRLAGFRVKSVLNHWPAALKAHAVHFPETVHFCADIRAQHADALGPCHYFHMSPDCKDHSRAKGGQPLDLGKRGLAEEGPRYLLACNAWVASYENVPEFVDWGPLIEVKGKMVRDPNRRGEYFRAWVATHKAMGFVNFKYWIIDSADEGGAQNRKRFFGIFSREGIEITKPLPTHDRYGRGGLPKWRCGLDILEHDKPGTSVFDGEPYVDATLWRLVAGVKAHAPKRVSWFLKYVSNPPSGKPNPGYDATQPLHTIMCQRTPLVVRPIFANTYYKNGGTRSLALPFATLTCKDRIRVAYGVTKPLPAFTFSHQFTNPPRSVSEPLRTILASRRHQYVAFSKAGPPDKLLDKPGDSVAMLALKAACREAGLVDLLTRMLTVREAMRAQGFPDWYTLIGTQTQQRSMVGNAVEVNTGLAVANEVRRMLDTFKRSGRTLKPLEVGPVLIWEQTELFGEAVVV